MSEKKRRCFVIGPIGVEGSPERKHSDMLLNAVIREALKDCDPPYEVVRSDQIDDPGMITDLMIHEIMNAELVIADLTYLNANAFYELGIRHAAEKPVIHFAQLGTKLPFDTIGHRAVMHDITSWGGIESARQQIREAVRRTEASDYKVSNPITQANASFKMRQSADPRDQVIAELQIRFEELEARLRRSFEGVRVPAEQVLVHRTAAARLGLEDRAAFLTEHEYVRRQKLRQDEDKVLLDRLPYLPTDADRILVAGYIVQSRSTDNGFGTGEANSLLTEQGIKVGNPSQLVKQNLLAKRLFKHEGRYRVSMMGVDHLNRLVGHAVAQRSDLDRGASWP